ncbi:MAG: DUF87 domain-containing protein [Acidobacteriota bacterium]
MSVPADVYEKLGAFYIGRPVDPASGDTKPVPLLYDAKDLTTHAVCVGMTGSGKTGLLVTLLEEAAIDKIPALVIDVKGDLANLMLTFPELRGEDFAPWVDGDEAHRRGLDRDGFGAELAELWRDGLESWDQNGDRITRMRAAVEMDVYTPGMSGVRPVSILASLTAPSEKVREDSDALRDRVITTVDSLLSLLDMDADPLTSREHILLSLVFERTWKEGRDLDLAGLIQGVQTPPEERVGVMPLETFFPAKDRFALAMTLNNLLAAPGFAAWLEGTPLDIETLLYGTDGKPRVSIFSIAHLGDAERMFFVSLLLAQVLGWMRGKPGTSSLRALLVMDEVFGYLPPVSSPPSKKPILTLLKQARAFGLGLVLATQNPVDLDYKALSNMGTWFLGRLQTERDKKRVLDGLETAAAEEDTGLDRAEIDRLLSDLDKRVFLYHNVHEDGGPSLFQVRWVLSYLAGPLTRDQLKRLLPAAPEAPAAKKKGRKKAVAAAATTDDASSRPLLPPSVPERFVGGVGEVYEPYLLGVGEVTFLDKPSGVEHREPIRLLIPAEGKDVDWDDADSSTHDPDALDTEPAEAVRFGALPDPAAVPRSYARWKKALSEHLYRRRRLPLAAVPELDLAATPGESKAAFRVRVDDAMRELRDKEVGALRAKFATKLERLEDRLRRAEQKLEKEQQDVQEQQMKAVLETGASVLGALFGGKRASTALNRASRGFGRSRKERTDVAHAEENLEAVQEDITRLEQEFDQGLTALELELAAKAAVETIEIAPRRRDVVVDDVLLVWVPV